MAQSRTTKRGPDSINTHVGGRVKMRRLMLGMSQDDLAKAIGLTFQQVQKYEKGTNRISVSRLVDISKVLKTPFSYFIEGSENPKLQMLRGVADTAQAGFEPDPMTRKDVMELVRAYSSIEAPQLKKQLLEMAKAMATSEKPGKKSKK